MVDGICKPVDEGENGSPERQSDLPKVTQLNLEVGKKSGARERLARQGDRHPFVSIYKGLGRGRPFALVRKSDGVTCMSALASRRLLRVVGAASALGPLSPASVCTRWAAKPSGSSRSLCLTSEWSQPLCTSQFATSVKWV